MIKKRLPRKVPEKIGFPAAARARVRVLDLPDSARPRERLLAEGAKALSDQELLAVILREGTASSPVLDVAAGMLARFGTLRELREAEVDELMATPGVGEAKAALLSAALELGARAVLRRFEPGEAYTGPKQVFEHCRGLLADETREVFLALYLDTRGRLIRTHRVSVGTINASLVHPREVFKPAVRLGASHIILAHNHPTGDPSPSQEDRDVTRRLRDAGRLLGIEVVDHVIVGQETWTSLAESMDLG